MIKRSNLIYIIGSVIIGIITIVSVFAGLIFSGTIDARSVSLVFTSVSQEKVYDGTALVGEEWHLASGELKNGHTASVTVTGNQTIVGSSENFLSVRILDANGADVTEDYDITCNTGTLTVTARPITISSATLEAEYNGAPIAVGEPEITAGELVAGDVAEFQMIGEIIDAGEQDNLFATTIINALGIDVTANYQITSVAGTVTVKGKPIVLKSMDDSKVYDGTPLTKEDFETLSGELVEGHSIEATYLGTITDEGEEDNHFTAKIVTTAGEDVTSNYAVATIYGTLEIDPCPIVVTTCGDSKQYDGTPLTYADNEFTYEGNLLSTHTLDVQCVGTQTNVGKSPNEAICTVTDENGDEVTHNYSFMVVGGDLEVTPRTVIVASAGGTKQYDGTPLVKNETTDAWVVDETVLVGEDRVEITITGSNQTDANSSGYENTCSASVIDVNGNTSSNYKIQYSFGKLVITPRELIIKVPSRRYTYDGQMKTVAANDCVVTNSNHLVNQDRVTEYELTSVGPDVGTYYVRVTNFKVENADGDDVTANYKPVSSEGTVAIVARNVTYTSVTDMAAYSGFALRNANYEITNGSLVAGHEEELQISGSQTAVGWSYNTVDYVWINDENGVPAEENYDIEILEGTLTVYEEEEENDEWFANDDGDADDDGDDWWAPGDEETDFVYLRRRSYGDYTVIGGNSTKNTWLNEDDYSGALLDNTYGMQYLTGLVLEANDYESQPLTIAMNESKENAKYNYCVAPYYLDDYAKASYYTQTSDVRTNGHLLRPASYRYYDFDYEDLADLDPDTYYTEGEYKRQAEAYANHVYETYLDLPDSTADYMSELLNEIVASGKLSLANGDDPIVMIPRIVEYIKSAAVYTENAKTVFAGSTDIIQSFFDKKIGVCQHYASAATALFRTLNFPARYTIGFRLDKSLIQNNTLNGIPAEAEQHAWVEVFVDGIGWIMADVTAPLPEPASVQLNIKSYQMHVDTFINNYGGRLEITAADVSSADLTALKTLGLIDSWDMEFTNGVMTSSGKKTVRIIENSIRFYLNGADVTERIKAQYILKCGTGSIHVYESVLWVETASNGDGFVYNGTAQGHHEFANTDYSQLKAGHTVNVRWTGAQKNVGQSRNTCSLTVTDENGANQTDIYLIRYTYGTIKVTPLSVIIKAESAEKVYDGRALTCNEYKITYVNGSLVATDEFKIKIEGTQTNIGTSDNTVKSVSIKNTLGTTKEEQDATDNYIIKVESGRLRVTKN